MQKIKYLLEVKAFTLFSFLGEKMGIESRRIRLFFVYASFITIGSPLLALIMVTDFWVCLLNNNKSTRSHDRLWDL